jgi:hypothetical protein
MSCTLSGAGFHGSSAFHAKATSSPGGASVSRHQDLPDLLVSKIVRSTVAGEDCRIEIIAKFSERIHQAARGD